MLRQTAKRVLERVLCTVGGDPGRMAGRALVLAYHNVVPDQDAGKGDRSLHLPWSSFLRQLNLLQHHCRVVSLQDILQPAGGEMVPRVAISFDDAYAGAVELALPEVTRRGLPATLFVAPGLLEAQALWWDALAEGPGLSDHRRRSILEEHAGLAELPTSVTLPASYRCAGGEQVRELAAAGVTLGAHSWSHPNLARLEPGLLAEELGRPLEWLRGIGSGPAMLAYPYGLCSTAVERAAEREGYIAGFRVDGGWIPQDSTSRWALPRFNVPAGLSDDGFLLRLAGRLAG